MALVTTAAATRQDLERRAVVNALHRSLERYASPKGLWVFASEVVVWWHEAGRMFYSRKASQEDDGLRGLVTDAVLVLGGWRVVRAILKHGNVAFAAPDRTQREAIRAIHLPD